MGGVISANADNVLHLVSNLNNWNTNDSENTYLFSYTNDGTQEIYEYTITSSMLSNAAVEDLYFRINFWDNWGQLRPATNENNGNGAFTFSENGQWQTWETWSKGDSNGAFEIAHSSIKAAAYKITVYRKQQGDKPGAWVKAEIISMPAKVSSLGYSTFSCDRALDLDNATGITVYKASVNTDNKVVLTKVTGKVAAGTGLLLAGEANATGTIPVVTTDLGESVSGNLLKATVTAQTVTASTEGAYRYFLAGTSSEDIGFYYLAADATSGAGKAYLETTTALANESGSDSRAAWIFQNSETTGIKDATRSLTTMESTYDLLGRPVKGNKAGLYIKNGKKVIVK